MTEYVAFTVYSADGSIVWQYPYQRWRAEEIIQLIDKVLRHPFFEREGSNMCVYTGDGYRIIGMTNNYFIRCSGPLIYQFVRLFKDGETNKILAEKYMETIQRVVKEEGRTVDLVPMPTKIWLKGDIPKIAVLARPLFKPIQLPGEFEVFDRKMGEDYHNFLEPSVQYVLQNYRKENIMPYLPLNADATKLARKVDLTTLGKE